MRWSSIEISAKSAETISSRVDTSGDGIPVVVYNPLGWERSGEVKVDAQLSSASVNGFVILDPAAGNQPRIPIRQEIDAKSGVAHLTFFVSSVPALGYKVVRLVPSKEAVPAANVARDSGDTIQLTGDKLSLTVSKKTGCIVSLKQGGVETLAPGACGNQLQAFKDTPKQYDAWNIDPGTLDQPPTMLDSADSVVLVNEKTPRPGIRVTRTWQSSKFVQTISLKGDQADVESDIDWHEKHVLLKAAFPLAATSGFATYEIPYGSIERPTTRNNSWEKAQFEVPAMRWADLGDGKHGLSVLNQGKYGYDAVGNLLRLTLLRAPTWPDPEADQGHHHFHYALYPHAGTWKDALTVRHGWEYDYPLAAVATTAHAGSLPAQHSFAAVSPENVVLTAVKKAEDADGLIFRAYEWAGKDVTAEFHVPPGATGATVTNLMEKPEGNSLAVTGDVVKVPIHHYEILTIQVNYPKAGNRE